MVIMRDTKSEGYYTDQINVALKRCHENFERADLKQVELKRSAQDARQEIDILLQRELSLPATQALSSILPFTARLEEYLGTKVSVCNTDNIDEFLWGLVSLLIELSIETEEEYAVVELSQMFRSLGHRLEILHLLQEKEPEFRKLEEAAVEIRMELMSHLNLVRVFFQSTGPTEMSKSEHWQSLLQSSQSTCNDIDAVIHRIERLASHAKQSSHTEEIERLRILLSLQEANLNENAKLPCVMLPRPKDAIFYDRDHIIDRMDAHLENKDQQAFRSLALHGLGGVGKSHIALKYARSKAGDHDAVLWIHAETPASLSQSFSDIAVRIQLPGAEPQKHSENRAIVLNWLQGTKCKWLLIYDNAEDPDLLLEYWPPVASQGKAVITSRNHFLAFSPAETGIEVHPFDPDAGSKFVLQLLQRNIAEEVVSGEIQSAKQLSEKLDGHALAISQMTALIHRKLWSIDTFLAIYEKNTQKIHHFPGYTSLDAVWQVSFEQLDLFNSAILGVLAYIMPDSIPFELFKPHDYGTLPKNLTFCADEWSFSEALDNLIVSALVKRDDSMGALSLHRLVQTQYRYFLDSFRRQEAFENAIDLLHEAFPQPDFARTGQLYDRWTQCQRYSQHVISLKGNFKKERNGSGGLKPTVNFCKLLRNFARYLLEQASYEELEDVVTVADSSFCLLSPEIRDSELEAGITTPAGLMWAHRGQFERSEELLKKTYTLQTGVNPPDPASLSGTELNLANVITARGRYDEILEWQHASLESARLAAKKTCPAPRPGGVLCQNIGRTLVYLGRHQEAHVWLGYAIREFTESSNGAMLAYTYFVRATLYRKEAALEMAKEEFLTAQNVWLKSSQLVTHHFNGACEYKLGCVATDQGEYNTALKHLESSLVIARLHQRVLIGDCARVLNKISEVLRHDPERLTEANEKEKEANRLARQIRNDFDVLAAVSGEQAFDQLVYILWR